jgi:hypothetical protein
MAQLPSLLETRLPAQVDVASHSERLSIAPHVHQSVESLFTRLPAEHCHLVNKGSGLTNHQERWYNILR